MYNCGPTVYSYAHIGNARAAVVADILFRLLREIYGESSVVYARNITDVDDKIIKRAKEDNVEIHEITEKFADIYNKDLAAIGCLRPTEQPKCTEYIDSMVKMISLLISKKFAYMSDNHVFFDVSRFEDYGNLSGNNLEDLITGARLEEGETSRKRNYAYFVLWKPELDGVGWNSPFGKGRPGWHIECSAMAKAYLGEVFDIHAGGLDLIFPHHENEIAQSCCAHDQTKMAHYWLHNGFVTMNDEKMSKSLGNIISVTDAADQYRGETLRAALLSAHYRAPLDLSDNAMRDARNGLDRLYRAVGDVDASQDKVDADFIACLLDDLNTPAAMARLHELARLANKGDDVAAKALKASGAVLGLLQQGADGWAKAGDAATDDGLDDATIDGLIEARKQARANREFAKADEIRDQLTGAGIILEDSADGTIWRRR